MAKGIDVSNNNGHIDWSGIKRAGYSYAICKATEGLGFVDSFYPENRRGAKAHGIHFGAYHFYSPGEDAAAQVGFFIEHAKPAKGDIVPTLDYERSPMERGPAEQFAVAMHRETGHYPMFYSYLSFIQGMRIPASSVLAHCPLWLADYTTVRPAPPAPWHEIVIWQHSSTGRVPGIGGSVDLDTGSPPTTGPGPITHYEVHFINRHGHKEMRKTTAPALWQLRHPRAKKHGHLGQDPIRKQQ